jgi:hypothetical protein
VTFSMEHLDSDSSSYLVILGLAPMTGITHQVFVSQVMGLAVIVRGVPRTNSPLLVVYLFLVN